MVDERVRRAFMATRALSIPDEKVKPVLKQLLRVYEKKWELIEAENYRALIDACFYADEEKNTANNGVSIKESGEDSKRPYKKLNAGGREDRVLSISDRRNEGSSNGDRGKDLVVVDHPSNTIKNHANRFVRSGSSVLEVQRQLQPIHGDRKRKFKNIPDITKGTEKVEISLVDEIGNEDLPKFTYIPQNIGYQNAYVHISLARISDEDCCASCKGDCLSRLVPCACARETAGEFAYTKQGLLKDEFLDACILMKKEPEKFPFLYCQDCPLERNKNEDMPEKCNGHLIRKFIKECWRKCGCDMQCGNRIVQRGIKCNLQVFLTREGKGWGVRTLQDLPKGSFVCEYVGEILTNTELYERNLSFGSERHTYPVTLDADWGSEKGLKDEEALCLDATVCGNVARFINHRCHDANLIDIPVEIETPDRHYYHVAFFTTREVRAMEELTWDYLIDFSDHSHPVKAFRCCCGSNFCRDVKPQGSRDKSSQRGSLVSATRQPGARTVSVKRE